MKYSGLVLLALALSVNVMGQSKQDGFVKEYNENAKRKPIEGVELRVANAGSEVSGKQGDFQLKFRTAKPGDLIDVQNIYKSGYEVFNTPQLEVWRIASDNTPFTILMCNSSKFAKIKDGYHTVAYKSAEAELDKALNELEAMRNSMTQEEYDKRVNSINDRHDNFLDKLDTYIDQFSRIDLVNANDVERRVVELVNQGKIKEAIVEYDKLELSKLIEQNYIERQKAEAVAQSMDRIIAESFASESEYLISLRNRNYLKMMQGNLDVVDEILQEYESLAEKCPKSIGVVMELVDFANLEGDYVRIEKWGKVLIDSLTEHPKLLVYYLGRISIAEYILGNDSLGLQYSQMAADCISREMKNNPESMLRDYVLSQSHKNVFLLYKENGIQDFLAETDKLNSVVDSIYNSHPDVDSKYICHLAKYMIYDGLSMASLRMQDINKALETEMTALSYLDFVEEIDNSDLTKEDFVATYNNLGQIYMLLGDFDTAERYLFKSKEILDQFDKNQSYSKFDKFVCYGTFLGMLYFYKGEFNKSIQVFSETKKYVETILQNRPYPVYMGAYSEIINNMGYICLTVGDLAQAESSFRECIEMFTPYAEKNPFKHLDVVCVAQINLGTVLLMQGRYQEFLNLQNEYWDNVKQVANWLGSNFTVSYAIACDNKGYYELATGNTDAAMSAWNTIIELSPNYLDFNPTSLLHNALVERGLIK